MSRSFDQWKSLVNQYVEQIIGLSCDDLPDVNYRDWYDDGVSPQVAARRAINAAREY